MTRRNEYISDDSVVIAQMHGWHEHGPCKGQELPEGRIVLSVKYEDTIAVTRCTFNLVACLFGHWIQGLARVVRVGAGAAAR